MPPRARSLVATLASAAAAWRPPPHRMRELFPMTEAAAARNADPDAVFVITGASGGIGAAMVEHLATRVRGTVIAGARDPSKAPRPTDRVKSLKVDLSDDASLATFAEAVGPRCDVLVNCVGLLHDADRGPERSLDAVDRDWLLTNFDVNCAGPLLATRALRKALDAGRKGPRPPSVVASLSARVGSLSDNGLGGWYVRRADIPRTGRGGAAAGTFAARIFRGRVAAPPRLPRGYSMEMSNGGGGSVEIGARLRYSYRASKAALHMATINCAIELKRQRTICVALHPGTTDTALSLPFQARVNPEKLFPAEFSAGQLLDVVNGLTEEHSGGVFDWAGERIEY